MKYRKALVTGGAGFIGSHIVEKLLKLGLEVTVIDNFYMGKKQYVPKGAKIIKADVLDLKNINKIFKGQDVVFHEAARVSIRNSIDNFYDDANVNIIGTVNVIQAVIKNNVKKLIYASSMAAYGDADYLPINEKHPLNPNSPYGVSKLASEKYCLEMSKFFGFDTVVLRYFNTYGPKQTLTPYVGVITIFINLLLTGKSPVIFGDGKQVRDFISVEDVADANILAMENDIKRDVFNIGTGLGRSVNEVAQLLIKKINPAVEAKYGPIQPGEPASSIADISKAREVLNFLPRFKLEDKIDEVIAWNKVRK